MLKTYTQSLHIIDYTVYIHTHTQEIIISLQQQPLWVIIKTISVAMTYTKGFLLLQFTTSTQHATQKPFDFALRPSFPNAQCRIH